MFDPHVVARDFPILQRQVHDKPLVYLDNAATSQKPQAVIDALTNYYTQHNANVHRGVHQLSDESTRIWLESRERIARFFGAEPAELILTRNTTEAINGVAYGWEPDEFLTGDIVLVALREHHSNLVVWQEFAKRYGADVDYISLQPDGRINLESLERALRFWHKQLVVLSHVSNTLGVVEEIEPVVKLARAHGTRVLLDGAQSAPHLPIDFHALDVDFFTFSGHKMLGPMGIGGLLVKKELLESGEFKPWLFGGGMISEVHCEGTTFHDDPVERFTAGTPDVASAAGLAAACTYMEKLGRQHILDHDLDLVQYALERLANVPEVQHIGPLSARDAQEQPQRAGSVAFLYDGVHAHDVAQILDSEGVAVRSGHHCTMPLHEHFGWQATVRASFQVYNSRADIDRLVAALGKVKTIFK